MHKSQLMLMCDVSSAALYAYFTEHPWANRSSANHRVRKREGLEHKETIDVHTQQAVEEKDSTLSLSLVYGRSYVQRYSQEN
jgi:hypothetical protein